MSLDNTSTVFVGIFIGVLGVTTIAVCVDGAMSKNKVLSGREVCAPDVPLQPVDDHAGAFVCETPYGLVVRWAQQVTPVASASVSASATASVRSSER